MANAHTSAHSLPTTLGALRASGWQSIPVKEELRRNAVARISAGQQLFEGVLGYEDTVMPQLENALLAGHDVIFLGERGQAKTRMIRSLTGLLDEWMPIIEGSEINDDPYNPVSRHARELVEKMGDNAPISWVNREDRYGEKLATPDTSIADLIGEVDPIKVAEGRYLSDELTIHYGLVPRTNRGIFAINELPDLAERIQVGLLNVLEERDVQIRGYKIRLPLDVMLVASANPEDYTVRRALRMGETQVAPRVSDLASLAASTAGKVEFETTEDGRESAILENIVKTAVLQVFKQRVTGEKIREVVEAFDGGVVLHAGEDVESVAYGAMFTDIPALRDLVTQIVGADATPSVVASAVEFVLEGLHLSKRLNKESTGSRATYRSRG